MKNKTLFWTRVVLYSLLLLTTTAYIVPFTAFGAPAAQITELVPQFWDTANPYFDYITADELYSNEVAAVIAESAVIPAVLEPMITSPVHNYIYVAKAPTLTTDGVGIVEALQSNGSTQKIEIKLKRLTQKSLPPIVFNTYISKARDLMIDGVPHAEVIFQTIISLTDWEYFHLHSNVLKLVYFTEDEFSKWEYTVKHRDSGQTKKVDDSYKNFYTSQTKTHFELKIKNSDEGDTYDTNFDTTLIACMKDGEKISLCQEADSVVMSPVVFAKKPAFVDIEHPREMFETEPFTVVDKTNAASKKVLVDFVELDTKETEDFFAGRYFFPLAEKDTIHSIEIIYTSSSGVSSSYRDHVITYTFKPRAHVVLSGESKENRALAARVETQLSEYARKVATVQSALSAKFSEVNTLKTFYTPLKNGSMPHIDDAIRYKIKEQNNLAFIATMPGRINFETSSTASAPNAYIQRDVPKNYFSADELHTDIIILPDLPPATILLPYSLSMSRLDALKYFSDAVSLDGDNISDREVKLIKLPSEVLPLTEGMRLGLGKYRLELTAKEQMVGYTYKELLPSNYERISKQSAEFEVDNYSPSTIMSLDSHAELPKADITIITDKIGSSDIVSSQRVEMTNLLRENGIDAMINHHDKAVYTYSMRVYDSNNTGTSYPPSSYRYSSNGYKGTLSLDSVSNNPRSVDKGSYKTVNNSHSVSVEVPNNTSDAAVYKWRNGSWVLVRPWSGKNLPNKRSYSCSGHGSVTLDKTGAYFTGNSEYPTRNGRYEGETWSIPFDFVAIYTGTCSYTERKWEPNYVSVDNYTGYYSGNVQKSVVKTFTEQHRMFSDELHIYFEYSENEEKLVHSINAETGIPEIQFKGSAARLTEIILEQLKDIVIHENTVIIGEKFIINQKDEDLEGDAILLTKIHMAHDPTVFHNQGTNISGDISALPDTLQEAGKYTIERSITDAPPVTEYSKSAASTIGITAHRRPLANFDVDWHFENGLYSILIDDNSKDPDFEFDSDKGITTRVYRYKKSDGAYIYKKPVQLGEGDYTISLAVKDKHGAWSEECVRTISLKTAPDVLLEAKLRGESYDISSIPAGEKIIVYDIKSKYHDNHDISASAFNNNKIQYYSKSVPLGKDWYSWDDMIFTIPENTIDGRYFVKISSHNKTELLPLNVNTPISISAEVSQREQLELRAATNRYAVSVTATVFAGTPYEKKITLIPAGGNDDLKKWRAEVDIEAMDVPDGIYTTEFIAVTAAGKKISERITEEFVFLKIKSVGTTGAHNIWNTNRYMGYEKIEISVLLSKAADAVEVRFSPELEAMNFRNSLGANYSYKEEFGYTVNFPIQLQSDNGLLWSAKYILPITKSTISWDGKTLREPYKMYIKAYRNKKTVEDEYLINITGNVHDRIYVRPIIE